MIAGFHLIWTAYGCWLPNDPRGSSSHDLRVDKLASLGEVHLGRKPTQPPGREIRAFYQRAEEMLEHARILFTDEEIALVGHSFGRTIREQGYTCYGCAIMPDHVHVMMRRHRDRAEQIIDRLQADGKRALIAAGRRAVNHPVWAGRGWKVFLNTREDMARVARYIALNPVKAGRAEQKWEFVEEYDGWMPAPNLR